MPKASSITKEMVLDTSFEIVRTKGFSSLSARSIAQSIGCSTQPIYWVYDNMEILRQEIAQKAVEYLNEIIRNYRQTNKLFADIGLGYIYVAHKESFLFKSIFIDNISGLTFVDLPANQMIINILKKEDNKANIEDIAIKGWIFAHGIASLVATGMMLYDANKIEKMILSFGEDLYT